MVMLVSPWGRLIPEGTRVWSTGLCGGTEAFYVTQSVEIPPGCEAAIVRVTTSPTWWQRVRWWLLRKWYAITSR